MTRTRRAAVRAAFGYTQYAVAILSGIVLVPLVLHRLGARQWGLWLASGELLGYAALVDLGVLGVLPWMLAESDGRKDRTAMRTLIANGLLVGAIVGVGYAVVIGALWTVLPSILRLSPADRAMIGPPLVIVIVATAIGYPCRVFSAVLAGIQDVVFNGALAALQTLVGVVITLVLLLKGYGLYALAFAAAVPPFLTAAASLVRIAIVAPDLLWGWPRPAWDSVRHLLTNGVGVWLGIFGWQLVAEIGRASCRERVYVLV